MTAVKISGTFKKDTRPNNGLESIAEDLVNDELARHVIVGIVELHHLDKDPGEAPVPTIKFIAIEPLHGDAEDQGRQMLDQARKARGLGQVDLTLFDESPAAAGEERDPTAGPWPGDKDYQAPADAADPPAEDGPNSDRKPDEWLDPDGKGDSGPAPKGRRK